MLPRSLPLISILLLLNTAHADDRPVALAAEAVAASPSLAALAAREEALRARAAVAGVWPDPVLSVEYSNAPLPSLRLADSPMSGLQLRAVQPLRPIQHTALSTDLGERRADVAGLATKEAALQLSASVQQTWWLLVRSRQHRALTRLHLDRAEELLSAARSRYETGSLGQHAVLRLEVLQGQLTDELADFDRADAALTAALDGALSRTGGTYDTPDAVAPLAPPPDADWRVLALAHRPLLAGLEAEAEAAGAAVAVHTLDRRPDVSVWAGYRLRTAEERDLVSAGLSVAIPTGSAARADGEIAAAAADQGAAQHRQQAALDAIDADMAAALARWRRSAEKATTYRDDLLPRARAVLETTRADFAVGRADFASLFEAEVALLTLERAALTAAVDTWLAHADALALLGTSPLGAP